ncbi:hypothetical protein ACLOJK_027979 [Asimina triloba]
MTWKLLLLPLGGLLTVINHFCERHEIISHLSDGDRTYGVEVYVGSLEGFSVIKYLEVDTGSDFLWAEFEPYNQFHFGLFESTEDGKCVSEYLMHGMMEVHIALALMPRNSFDIDLGIQELIHLLHSNLTLDVPQMFCPKLIIFFSHRVPLSLQYLSTWMI